MKSKYHYISAIVWLACFFMAGVATGADLSLNLSTGKTVTQGDNVTIPVLASAEASPKRVAGAAFTITFDSSQLELLEVTSDFFDTFAAQQISPASVTVGQQEYAQPLVVNNSVAGKAMVAAARVAPEEIPVGSTVEMFNLVFKAKINANVADHTISLAPSVIDNTAAGYPEEGAEIAALIGMNPDVELTDPEAFTDYSVALGETLLAITSYGDADNDNDGADNKTEIANGTDPDSPDSDGDGRTDGDEIHGSGGVASNPLIADSDGDGALDGHEVLAGTDPGSKDDTPEFTIYTQQISLDHQWKTIDFSGLGSFASPIIVAKPASSNELDVSFIQIRNIDAVAGTYEARLKDASNEDPSHQEESVDVILMESGAFVLPNGAKCLAKKYLAKAQTKAGIYQKVKFPSRFFKYTPVVLASVTTSNDEDIPVDTRIHAVAKTGFSLLVQEEQYQLKYDPKHPSEVVSYLAIEPLLDIVGDYVMEVRTDKKAVIHAPAPGEPSATVKSLLPTTAVPSFVAQTQSVYDKDPVSLRVVEVNADGADVYLVEDTSLDELKTTHKQEHLGVMFLSPVTIDDTDGDGLTDLDEFFIWGSDPEMADSDGDRLEDGEEIVDGVMESDPNNSDTDGDLIEDGVEVFAGSDPKDATSTPPFTYVVGKISVNHNWQTVSFPVGKSFFDTVVVATPATLAEPDSTFIQIGEITSTGFKIRLRETSNGNGTHTNETIHYLATDKGYFTLPDGSRVIAGKTTSKAQTRIGVKQKATFKLPRSKRFKRTPAVFASVAASGIVDDQVEPTEIRIDRPSKVGFSYVIQEEQAQEKTHPAHTAEQLCFVAFEPFTGIIGDTVFDIGLQSKAATHLDSPIVSELAEPTSATPGFIASLQTILDRDPATLRVVSVANDGAVVRVVEDQSLDSLKLEHRAESIAHLFFTPVTSDDNDGDGLSNLAEFFTYGTDLENDDHDGDGLVDGDEIANNTDPTKRDSDGDGFSDGHEVNFAGTNPNDDNYQPGLFLHVGSVDNVTEQVQTVQFGTDEHGDPIEFWDPVLVARPASYNEADPTFIQISNVTKTHFDIRLTDTGGAADQQHQAEQIHFLVIDSGHYAVPGGERVFAGKFDSTRQTRANRFQRIRFLSRFFRTTPVAISSLNSVNDAEPARVRLERISRTGLYATIQEDSYNQKKSPGHPSEKIAVIAWEPFTGIESGVVFEVDKRLKAFTSNFKDLEFNRIHSGPPFFIAEMQTAYDKDSASLRFQNLESSKISLFVQEDDAIADGKISHTRGETVGYFAISAVDEEDIDGDGLGNDFEELVYHTDWNNSDTDGDGLRDGDEVNLHFTDPLVKDTDGDGSGDGHEMGAGTDPLIVTDTPDPFIKIIEVNTSVDEGNSWVEIDTTGFYDPVIVASSASADRQQLDINENPRPLSDFISAIVQVRKKSNGNFEIRTMPTAIMGTTPEPVQQRIHVALIERGSYTTDEGNVIIADSDSYQQKRKAVYKRVKFPRNPQIRRTAVVFASVSSSKDEASPVYHRLNNINRTGFYYMFQEEESQDQVHVILDENEDVAEEGEELSYIVFGGSGKIVLGAIDTEINGVSAELEYDAQILVKKVDDELIYALPRQAGGAGPILQGFMMDMQKTYDRDPANLRFTESWRHDLDPLSDPPSMYYPFVAEDQSKDLETSHKLETFGLLRFMSPSP